MKLVGRIAEVEKIWCNCNCSNCSCTRTPACHLLKMLKLSLFSIIKFKSILLFVQLYIRKILTLTSVPKKMKKGYDSTDKEETQSLCRQGQN